MMGATDLLLMLRSSGYSIKADNGFIDISPADELPPELIPEIKQLKPEILAQLAREAREQKVIAMLAADPALFRAVTVEDTGDPQGLIMTVAIRAAITVTAEMRLPRAYDPFKLLYLIEQHGQATH